MTIDEGLKTLLRAGLSNQRVYSHKAPQTLPSPADDPYIVIYRISPTPWHLQTGPPSMIWWRFQISAYGVSQSVVSDLADDARRYLNGFQGLAGDIVVHAALWKGGGYGYNEATGKHHFWNDIDVHYTE